MSAFGAKRNDFQELNPRLEDWLNKEVLKNKETKEWWVNLFKSYKPSSRTVTKYSEALAKKCGIDIEKDIKIKEDELKGLNYLDGLWISFS